MAQFTSESEGEFHEEGMNRHNGQNKQRSVHRANEVDLKSRQQTRRRDLTSPTPSPPHIYTDRSDRSISPVSDSEHTRKKMRYDTSDYTLGHGDNMKVANGRATSGRFGDTRRHVPHYEDPRSQRGRIVYEDAPNRRGTGSRNLDYNRNGNPARGRGRGRNIEHERPGDKRPRYSERSRSRSPYHRGRDRSRSPFRHARSRSRSPYHAGKQRKEGRAQNNEASVDSPQNSAQDHRIDYSSNDFNRTDHGAKHEHEQPGPRPAPSKYSQRPAAMSANTSINQRNMDTAQRNVRFANDVEPEPVATSVVNDPESEPEPEPIDEDAEIARRRLRRAAIRARFASQQASTLSQELSSASVSRSTTPAAEATASPVSRSISPAVQSPNASQNESSPGSPSGLGFPSEDELANHAMNDAMDIDSLEQSAADYDPTADIEEERLRAGRPVPEASSAAFDELKQPPNHTSVPVENKIGSHDQLNTAAEDFDDEDYDMFAEHVDERHFMKRETTAPERNAAGAQTKKGNAGNSTDSEGYYRPRPKEIMDKQYEVIRTLGSGVFSNVCQAQHISTGRLVAIKIVRKNDMMQKQAVKEINFLQRLNEADAEDKKHIVRYQGQFEHMGLVCMVFESLHENLRDLVKRFGRHHGLSIKAVRSYGRQIFIAMSMVKKMGIVHADLKPDNIIVTEDHVNLKICDFGSARDPLENHDTAEYLASRFYRGPEVMLGLKCTYAFDIWSIGCTLWELYTGNIAFNGNSNNHMLKLIQECRGKFSMKFLKKGLYAGKHFEDDGKFCSNEWNAKTGQAFVRHITFTKPLPGRDLRSRIYAAAKNIKDVDYKELDLLIDLLDKCLQLNPERRITPVEALQHPFFTYNAKVVTLKRKFKAVKN